MLTSPFFLGGAMLNLRGVFFLILHYWQYRLNIGFSRGCFLGVTDIAPKSGF